MIDPADTKTRDLVALAAAQSQTQQVVATYGDAATYNYDRVLNECVFFMDASAKAAIELGKRLILLKEMEGYGNFGKALEALGIHPRTAQRVMSATLRLPNTTTLSYLVDSVKSRSRLFELMTLDDDDIKELADGGTVAGIKLDDIDKMTSRELRVALREARELSGTKDKQLQAKNQKLDEMEGKLDNLSRKLTDANKVKQLELPKPEEEGRWIRSSTAQIVATIETDGIARQLTKAFTDLQTHTHKTGIDHTAFMAGCINQILRTAKQVQADFQLWIDDENLTPYWETDTAGRAAEEAIAKLDIDWMHLDEGTLDHGETQH